MIKSYKKLFGMNLKITKIGNHPFFINKKEN